MHYESIDSVYLSCPDLDAACALYERLGLQVSTVRGLPCLEVGPAAHRFRLCFLVDLVFNTLPTTIPPGSALRCLSLQVASVPQVSANLAAYIDPSIGFPDTRLNLHAQAGTDIVLVEQIAADWPTPKHAFPLLRLDHLAIVAHDLEAKTRFWTDILGVPVVGEIVTPTLVIRQLRIGDAILELLGPASPESPIHQRVPGLVSMISWEVPNLDAAVQQARATGFTPSDPATGVLPGTRVATIPGAELAGVNMQLLQYV